MIVSNSLINTATLALVKMFRANELSLSDLEDTLKDFAKNVLAENMDSQGETGIKEARDFDQLFAVPVWGATYTIGDLFQACLIDEDEEDETSRVRMYKDFISLPFDEAKKWVFDNRHAIAKGFESGISYDWTGVASSIIDNLPSFKKHDNDENDN